MAVTEESLVEDLAKSYGGVEEASIKEASAPDELERTFKDGEEFTADFQLKLTALAMRDSVFWSRVEGILEPQYFDSVAQGSLVSISQRYFKKYRRLPDMVTLAKLIKEDVRKKAIRADEMPEIKETIKAIRAVSITDRDYAVDQVSAFAKQQSLAEAVLKSIELMEHGKYDEIARIIQKASEVGANEDIGASNYWKEIAQRTLVRKEEAAGIRRKRGITTGFKMIDTKLYHEGWGRKEFTLLMGGPKAGKSTALAGFAKTAAVAGYNVLICTLEVSKDIYNDRLDACIAQVEMGKMPEKTMEIKDRIEAAAIGAGQIIVHEYPSGMMSPGMLKRVIATHKANGLEFDMVVVDYADLMRPDERCDSPIESSKQIYTNLRAIAQEEDIALLSATQTNREGAKSTVAKMEHVAEDFNRIRIADLVFSINASESEKENNEARFHIVASRNQKGDYSFRIKQNKETMTFITEVLGYES